MGCVEKHHHIFILLLSNNLSGLQKACPGPGVGLGQGGPNGLDWFPGEALQCAAEGGCRLGMCSEGSGTMSLGRGWLPGPLPALGAAQGGLGRAVLCSWCWRWWGHVFTGCLSKLQRVEVPPKQQSPSHSQGKAFPSQRGLTALPAPPWLKQSPGG